MVVVGCDPAPKGIACVILPDSRLIWIPKKSNFNDTLIAFYESLFDIECDAAYIEEPIFVRNYAATLKMAQIFGIVKLAFLKRNIPIFGVNPSTWKKDIIGNGHADKEQIKQFVQTSEYFSIPGKDLTEDIADAACLALFGYLRVHKNI